MPTIRDVAHRAGVAPITASRAMNNSDVVSPQTKARVLAAAQELGYVPNHLARGLRSNRTDTLGLVLTDITNPFWTTVARGVEDSASRAEYSVIFCNTDESVEKQNKQIEVLYRKRVDGLLLVPASDTEHHLDWILAQRIPLVVLDRRVPVEVDTVRADSEQGAYQLIQHLIALGHRQIAVLGGPPDLSVVKDRVAGYTRALQDARLPFDEKPILYGKFTQASGKALTERALAIVPHPTALFAMNNFIALGAMHYLREQGVRVPEEISLVGFDDLPSNLMVDPFLTVAAQPAYEMGRKATELLLKRLAGGKDRGKQEIVLSTNLVVRGSTSEPPQRA